MINQKALPRSFLHRIVMIVSIGILVLALITSLLTSWVVSENEREHLIDQSLQVAESLAEQSILAILFESPENASDAVAAALSFPNIANVSLRHADNSVLLSAGGEFRENIVNFANVVKKAGLSASVIAETSDYIVLCAPIVERRIGAEEDVLIGGDAVSESPVIGFADIVVSKQELKAHRIETLIQNLVISYAVAFVMLLVLSRLMKRVTTPLRYLSTLMREQEPDKATSRAEVYGPSEIQDMAKALNSMMDVLDERDTRLRKQNDGLEALVIERTREVMKARDAAIRASKHKSAFLANMSHELRTPLNAVLGYTSMVMEDVRDDQFSRESCVDDLTRVENAGQHLLSMINNILDLAKIEAGRMELEFHEVELKHLLQQVEDSVLPLIRGSQNQLEVELNAHTDMVVLDPTKLRQVLVNLLSNASKFTENGVITMKVDYTENEIACAIRDTGIGMNQSQRERIFKAFRQADMTTTKNYGGTGLGLTISQRLCVLMGATLSVESKEGVGSSFSFTIPLPLKEHQEDLEKLAS